MIIHTCRPQEFSTLKNLRSLRSFVVEYFVLEFKQNLFLFYHSIYAKCFFFTLSDCSEEEFCFETLLTAKSIVSGTKIFLGDRKSRLKLNYRVEADQPPSVEKARAVSFCIVNTSNLSR